MPLGNAIMTSLSTNEDWIKWLHSILSSRWEGKQYTRRYAVCRDISTFKSSLCYFSGPAPNLLAWATAIFLPANETEEEKMDRPWSVRTYYLFSWTGTCVKYIEIFLYFGVIFVTSSSSNQSVNFVKLFSGLLSVNWKWVETRLISRMKKMTYPISTSCFARCVSCFI